MAEDREKEIKLIIKPIPLDHQNLTAREQIEKVNRSNQFNYTKSFDIIKNLGINDSFMWARMHGF